VTDVVRAAALTGFADLVRSRGVDPAPLLRRHGIGADELDQPDALIRLGAVALLLEQAANLTGCPDFGLRLANQQTPDMLGPLAVVLLNCSTVKQAIADMTHYLFLHSPAYEVVLDRQSPMFDDCASLRFDIRLEPSAPLRQLIDGCLGDTWNWTRIITESRFELRAVSLPHTPVGPTRNYRRFFGAPVFFAQPYAGLHVPKAVIGAPLRPANPMLRAAAIKYISSRIPPRSHTFADRVAHTLIATLGTRQGDKIDVAAILGLQSRTLQRRLEAEGTTFADVRESVLRRVAYRFLCETDLPVTQIASVLGYSEQAGLTRAARRWFNATPTQVRATAHSNESSSDLQA
jgi:AraC-like DNA-binding protein